MIRAGNLFDVEMASGYADLLPKLYDLFDTQAPPLHGGYIRYSGRVALYSPTAVPDFFDEINRVTNPFAMIADPQNGRFMITDGATGAVYSVAPEREIRAYSQVEGHAVLAGIG